MQESLKMLVEILDEIDNNPKNAMRFITLSLPTTTLTNKPPDNVRMLLLQDILFKFAYHNMYAGDEQLSQQFVDDTFLKINNKYEQYQHFCWHSHTHHFHPTFEQYVNCPITCICELSEFFTKLGRTLYAG